MLGCFEQEMRFVESSKQISCYYNKIEYTIGVVVEQSTRYIIVWPADTHSGSGICAYGWYVSIVNAPTI